jgi:hypothetical protein
VLQRLERWGVSYIIGLQKNARLEQGEQGANPRFIVTDPPGSPKALYERRYCARGESENRIKEAQLDLFGRRASGHRYPANQLRLLLAALACTATIRTKPLKIGAAVLRNPAACACCWRQRTR